MQPRIVTSALPHRRLVRASLALFLCAAALTPRAQAADTSAADQLKRWSVAAATPASTDKGRAFFTATHGGEWSCASCHGTPPVATGKHASTAKPIAPLAPAANAERFTDTAKVDKWFRRNCNDVVKRECSAAEKADVMAYLIGLKP
jgi:hypothetical protein